MSMASGEKTPSLVTSNFLPVAHICTRWPFLIVPSMTRKSTTTPW